MNLPSIGCWNIRGFNQLGKVLACKEFVTANRLDMICILEAKISAPSLADNWFINNHQIFPNEQCCINFPASSPARIWLKWNSSSVTFNPISLNHQFIHGSVYFGTRPPFFITIVYAANTPSERLPLWHNLTTLDENISSPWIVMGDFNCFREVKDKSGGNPIQFSRLGEFNNWVFKSGIMDLKAVGLRYTWFNGRVDDPIHIKLDRMLVNQEWLDCFPFSFYKVLPNLCSDHSPLLLSSGGNFSKASMFQFKNFWLKLDGFWDALISSFAIHHEGSPISNLYGKFRDLKMQLKQSNWANDHYIKANLADLRQKQNFILDLIQRNPLDHQLNASLKKINASISLLNGAWSSWIIQRAKAKWLRNGEDDLGFLYARIKSRANTSKIKEIITEEGHFTSPNEIAFAIVDRFKKLYNPTALSNSYELFSFIGDSIPDHLIGPLIQPVTDLEIKHVVFSGPSSSSLGPDGFTFEFFKATWEVIGFYVSNTIKNFFSMGHLPRCAKETAIALIPKHQHATNISDYRPISLCNVFYKIIAKILANRMKCVMPHIIQKSQAGFISKRVSTDNIILANEILNGYNGFSSKKFFCAKLDIRKAFDFVSWDFFLYRLKVKSFPDKFIYWIKSCVCEVSFSVCINGSLEGFFTSSAGLRHGCPLSPLLFVVVMDAFSCSLDVRPFIGIPCGSTSFSHLLYADDVLVFGAATIQNAWELSKFLKDFALASGLYTNNSKCSILFSNNTSMAIEIASILGFNTTDYFFEYLGLPISTRKLNSSHFQPLLSRISSLLDGWKVKFLSFAGRIQYIRFTIANTLAYWIRGAIIPKSCIKLIDRFCSRFLFHGSIEGKKLHLVAWKDTCLPTCYGGLGIANIQSMYHSFGCSFIWRMYNSSALIFDWLKIKYTSPWKGNSPKPSKFWKFIQGTAQLIKKDIKLTASATDCKLSFFWDPWLDGKCLADFFHPQSEFHDNFSFYTNEG
ncbi:Putative ribonuclease H protein [Dendrobium catenatum]|uniref:Ribonuclease H protein n=1 Tax=Dendrobium catenatum TaxID=906689 RepID=A0A2I0XFA1_9ASPA|nr:Putative ribonuclease H protein [Dendrobium catenatum]